MHKPRNLARLFASVLAAAALQSLVAGASMAAPAASKPAPKSTAKLTTKPSTRSATRTAVPKSPITFSITSRIRHGNLVVLLDGVPVFNEEFQKPALLISQTTTWDPLPVAAGKHKLTAKVYDAKGKTYNSAVYTLNVSRTKGIELRIKMKGSMLTIEPAS